MSESVSTPNSINIENMLRQYGVYPTQQRMAIARVLFAQQQHVTADQLHSRLQEHGSKVSKATVYNTLGLFATNGLLNEIFIDPNHVYYDSNNSHHHHFYNVDTGQINVTGHSKALLPSSFSCVYSHPSPRSITPVIFSTDACPRITH